MHTNEISHKYRRDIKLQYDIKIANTRAVSGISGSRVPDNRLGYPNPNFGSGTRNVALWEKRNDDLTHQIVL